jgi:protease-4
MKNNRIVTLALGSWAVALGGCFTLGLGGGVPEMEERVVEDNGAADKVAVIEVTGEMTYDPSTGGFPFGGGRENIVARTKEQLDLAVDDDEVRAVVVRISSPGGEVYPSLEIHRELRRFREATGKPVVAYVPDVAASGGYLAAVGADEIVADESALTGSIGVILMIPEVTGLMQLVGVKVNVFKAGEHKDVGNPFREMTDEDRAEIMKVADYYHARFKGLVNAGRSELDAARVEELADGRVFTAPEALENGLVDAVGDLGRAHELAAARAGLSAATTNLVVYRRPGGYGRNAFAIGSSAPGGVQINLNAAALAPGPHYLFLWRPGM